MMMLQDGAPTPADFDDMLADALDGVLSSDRGVPQELDALLDRIAATGPGADRDALVQQARALFAAG